MATGATKKTNKPTTPIPLHRILREVLRHYTEYRELVNQDGRMDIIEYGYWIYHKNGNRKKKEQVTISFWDLHNGLKELAPRKREAIFYNVILDEKQKDVAEKMGITTVSVGQYVEAGTIQLAKKYFSEHKLEGNKQKDILPTNPNVSQGPPKEERVHEKTLSSSKGGNKSVSKNLSTGESKRHNK